MRREVAGLLLGLLMASSPALARAEEPSTQHAIESSLMCYCGCANLSIRICTCGTAEAIRQEIAERLEDGQSRDQVVQAFVERHGEQILASPVKSGFNLMAWIAPFGALLAGGVALTLALRRWSALGPDKPTAESGRPAATSTDEERKLSERVERELREGL